MSAPPASEPSLETNGQQEPVFTPAQQRGPKVSAAAATHAPVTGQLGWLVVLCIGCSEPSLSPVPELTRATDMNPDPKIVEVTLVATTGTTVYVDGRATEVFAYRDGAVDGSVPTVPGPMIEANQGDRLIVHFRNELPDRPSSVHWHGLRLPIEMDGVNAIAAGASFDYDFTLLDAGWFWYHPHIETDEQIELGLQGQLLVRGANEPAIAVERTLVLDDVELDDRGQIRIEPSHEDLALGRRGDTLLVNGKPPGSLVASAGSVERWRLVNTSNGRFFDLRLEGLPLRVIGWDGGLISQPYDVDHLVIAPGERYDVVVAFNRPRGSALTLQTLPFERGHGGLDAGPFGLVRFELDGDAIARDEIPFSGPSITKLPVSAQTVTRRFALSESLDGPQGAVFFINDQRWPLNTPLDVRLGDLEIWEVVNEADAEHPVHVHGHFVQVLDRDGVLETQLGWKDTFVIGPKATVRAALRYEAPGRRRPSRRLAAMWPPMRAKTRVTGLVLRRSGRARHLQRVMLSPGSSRRSRAPRARAKRPRCLAGCCTTTAISTARSGDSVRPPRTGFRVCRRVRSVD